MTKRVLDVGQCPPDHMMIRRLLERHFEVTIVQAHGPDDTIDALRNGPFDLVLVNRKLDRDYSDGLEIVRQIKADAQLANVPVMLITSYVDHQDLAVAAGAERGFGKLELDQAETVERLSGVLN
ncbi:MAG: response regulator [Pirellulales bacterium]